MAYVDQHYYTNTFCGKTIPAAEFPRLAVIASDVVDMIVQKAIPAIVPDAVKRAVCYEIECLYEQGGVDAITGFAAGLSSASESLGSHSVSASSASVAASTIGAVQGIPVSTLAHGLLSNAGYMCRWTGSGRRS